MGQDDDDSRLPNPAGLTRPCRGFHMSRTPPRPPIAQEPGDDATQQQQSGQRRILPAKHPLPHQPVAALVALRVCGTPNSSPISSLEHGFCPVPSIRSPTQGQATLR
ncbi:hypothetical protein G6011_06665 [Alternaria panax]|uniref:Uncharacterized protein n=1 Tax=Alternaria panax TaxID=48097 RepID=A0AAD4FH96_9PLEO|nr:hypothetical protein G6011_06665 [Alternaria panax]